MQQASSPTDTTYRPPDVPVPPLMPAVRLRQGAYHTRRPASLKPPPPVVPTIRRPAGRLLAEFSAAFWWLLFWIFNGGCTAVSFAAAAQWLAGRFYAAPPVWVSYWLMVPAGIVVHLMISSIEQHLWQTDTEPTGTVSERLAAMPRLRTAEAVIIGSLDSVTTSRTICLILIALGAAPSMTLNVISAMVGTAMALVPEPMLRYHGVSLKTLVRR